MKSISSTFQRIFTPFRENADYLLLGGEYLLSIFCHLPSTTIDLLLGTEHSHKPSTYIIFVNPTASPPGRYCYYHRLHFKDEEIFYQ